MKKALVAVATLILVALAAYLGWRSNTVSVSVIEATRRQAADSAVLAFRGSVDGMVSGLRDSLDFYKAEAVAAARVVIRYKTVTVHDTVEIKPRGDSVTVAMPVIVSEGVTVTESLSVSPPPHFLFRSLSVRLDPDTVLFVIGQTPDGVQRIVAAASRGGTTVSEAAAKAPIGSRASEIASMAGCAVAGYGIAKEDAAMIGIGGALCAAMPLIRKLLPF